MPINIDGNNLDNISHSCILKLQAVYDSLKTAEKKAADLLIQNPELFSKGSIGEVSSKAGCSEATITRLSKKLGYDGYIDLKFQLTQSKESDSTEFYEDIDENDSYDTVVTKVFQASIQALSDTLNTIDKEQYEIAVNLLCNADKIIFCGVGDSANVALSGYQKFLRMGLNVQASADFDIQLINISLLKENDVVIVISHSGRTKSIVDLAKYTRNIGAKVICITNFPSSPLVKNSDVILLTAAFSEQLKGEVMAKRLTELCIIESLFVNLLLKKKTIFSRNIDKSNKALQKNKISSKIV